MGGPYGSVRAFTGTIIIDGTKATVLGGIRSTEKFRAEGPVTIADEQMPDGMHFQWPMVSPAALLKADINTGKGWQVHLVYSSTVTEPRLSALAQGQNVTCSATEDLHGAVGLAAPPGIGKFMLGITPPNPQRVVCSGMREGNPVKTTEPAQMWTEDAIQIEGKAPGPIGGTKDVTIGEWQVQVTYKLAPATGR
jgi:hypothetical protein